MPRYFATTAKGIEPVTADELTKLGATKVEPSYGGVYFEGDREILYKANLWLRTATRILVPLREFAAKTPVMLYDQVRRVKWDQYLDTDMTFAVDCTIAGQKSLGKPRDQRPPQNSYAEERAGQRPRPGQRSGPRDERGITHSHFAALKIKDAIADEFRRKCGARPNVDTQNPDVRINAFFHDGRCSLSLDAAGVSLHERGYRLRGANAPLKETLAAAIIHMTGWNGTTPFIDPMCGSGTLALEAALIGLNIAPGLFRLGLPEGEQGFMRWLDFDRALWDKLVGEAQNAAKKKLDVPILGFDRNREAVASALDNAKRAGLTKVVHFEKREFSQLEPVGDKGGVVIVNPPYGERLGEEKELAGLYELIGDLFKQRMKGWTGYILTGNMNLAKSVGLRASKRMVLFNGPIECRLLKYDMY